jgi:hypothetical protein
LVCFGRWGVAKGQLADRESAFDEAVGKLKKALPFASSKNVKMVEKAIQDVEAEKAKFLALSSSSSCVPAPASSAPAPSVPHDSPEDDVDGTCDEEHDVEERVVEEDDVER